MQKGQINEAFWIQNLKYNHLLKACRMVELHVCEQIDAALDGPDNMRMKLWLYLYMH
jgi:hypothetical protein